MIDYVVAVPSYKRSDVLQKQTLQTLDRLRVDRDQIFIFVADDSEREIYNDALGGDYRIVVGVKGISSQRKYYHEYFPEGQKIISLDDDIADVLEKNDDKLNPTSLTMNDIAEIGYTITDRHGIRMWGINAVANAFYMKDQITVGLRFICANFMGTYAQDWVYIDPERRMTPTGEDHHSTLRSFTKYGGVARIEYLTPKTKYWAKGGIDACVTEEGHTRAERHARQLQRVANLYPTLATPTVRKGTVSSLKLKPITHTRYVKGNLNP